MLLIKTYLRLDNFTKERDLMDSSQFHMAGKASQLWGERHVSHGGRQEKRACAGKLPFLNLSDLVRLIHYHKNSAGKTCPHYSFISHRVPPTTPGNCGSYISRWDLGGDTAKPYNSIPGSSQISCPHISKPIMPSQQSPKSSFQKSTVLSLIWDKSLPPTSL